MQPRCAAGSLCEGPIYGHFLACLTDKSIIGSPGSRTSSTAADRHRDRAQSQRNEAVDHGHSAGRLAIIGATSAAAPSPIAADIFTATSAEAISSPSLAIASSADGAAGCFGNDAPQYVPEDSRRCRFLVQRVNLRHSFDVKSLSLEDSHRAWRGQELKKGGRLPGCRAILGDRGGRRSLDR
jgi:hypothetical protein